jgi:hypothetical protein
MEDPKARARRLGRWLGVLVALLLLGPIVVMLWLERGSR